MMPRTIAELFDLTGKGAIVTGGAMGIGQAIAARLTEAGAGVMIADIDVEVANQTVAQIKARGGKVQGIRADVCSATDARNAVRATVESFGSLDVLVNNAGIYPLSSILDTNEEIWDKTHDVNLKGVFLYSQVAAKEMIKAGHGGKIINIASINALHPRGDLAHYSASKGGVVMLTKALALELAPHNILVNAVAPGGIVTPGTRAVRAAYMARRGRSEESMAHLPSRRMGTPDDIAKVVLFLASAAADYMTGSLVLVDGGRLLS